jgi:acyl-CoA-binding protein
VTVGEITIHVCNGISGEVVSTNVPDDIPVPDVIQLLENLYRIGTVGNQEQRVLYNISQKFEYEPTDTLAGRSTGQGDLNIVIDTSRCDHDPITPK